MNSIRQDYIQAIYRLSKDKGYTNNKSISEYFSISRPSVSEMIKKLIDDGLVIQEKNKIFLSELGDKSAKEVLSKHRIWECFLVDVLSIDGSIVHDQSDLLEHVTSEEMFAALNKFLNYPKISPKGKRIYTNENKWNLKAKFNWKLHSPMIELAFLSDFLFIFIS